jgi:phosphatidylserine/phosphatidylglycerophosphate/cardiolipin synthase-like enzyme
VSPWVSLEAGATTSLVTALEVASRDGAEVLVVTRPPKKTQPWHGVALETIHAFGKARIFVHSTLHAKFFVAESKSATFAVLGSANLTYLGSVGREVGVAIQGRSWGEKVIRDLIVLAQALRHDYGTARWNPGEDG